MDTALAINEFKQGLQLLRNQCPGNAVPFLRRAVEMDRDNPYYLSFLGLAVARALGKLAEAELLCASAVQLKSDDARLYLNLADVYVESNRREDARRTLRAGMQNTGPSALLKEALGRLQRRRPPVLRFLRRNHALNRHLGKLRQRVTEICDEYWRPY